ncbi:chemotaxis protein CheA [Chondrinema litorale]|uniref:chemotaxis protein CheA n=1 Tax=Chondrinema litorale TaxID=2994555 RepID=UPI002543EE31|nr:chemotaxis protein CheA [Chondrinema litorale]UZR98391.1 chemotaxis protein CheA [Chondrinema litorale]
MEEYQHKFIDDALDLLTNIEGTLLQLEEHPNDANLIEEIFRIMHTIKGAANMFGFLHIGELTHQLENIYDAIRNNRSKVNEQILSLTLRAIDHLRKILEDHTLSQPANIQAHQEIESAIISVLNDIDNNVNKLSNTTKNLPTFYLTLKPINNADWLENEPIHVFAELQQIGTCKIFRSTEANEISWPILLSTDQGQDAIEGVFLFSDHEFNNEIFELSKLNLLINKKLIDAIEHKEELGEKINLDCIKELILEVEQSSVNNAQTVNNITENTQSDVKFEKKETFKVSREKVDQMMEWVSEMVTMQGALKMLSNRYLIPEFSAVAEKIEHITSGLRESVFSISLVELSTLKTRFDRLIRDLSKSLGKEVSLTMEGRETELDKSIIERVTDPLLHILRNCMDHALETPEERVSLGKTPHGNILIKSYYTGNNIVIEIKDDGRGINAEKVRQKAIEKGIISATDVLDEKEIYQLIFAPGFSTAANVTDISGRGVGMDVVKKRVKELRGDVELKSVVNQGTTIIIKLPLTLSIMEGLLVKVKDLSLIIPLDAVHHCHKVERSEIQNAQKFNASVIIEQELLSIINLREKFGFAELPTNEATIVIVKDTNMEKGLVVDEVIGQQQIVLKPLGKLYQDQGCFLGGSVMGDGSLALVMDIAQLIQQNKQEQAI